MKLPRAHNMTIDELAGQMVMPSVNLHFFNRSSPDAHRLVRFVRKYKPGGIILFGGHPSDVHYWVRKLQDISTYPLLVAADLERGVGGLFRSGTMFPHALAWGAADDFSLVEEGAGIIATEARVLGINTIFAPVLDLVTEPDNPIINIRGFHADPGKVAKYGVHFIRTIQRNGIACVGKHFPGHGRTRTDSHLKLPELPVTFHELMSEDLAPFQQAMETGVQGIMTAHIRLADSPYPVTFRRDLLQDYLRRQAGFRGVTFSDALNMQAIDKQYSVIQQIRLGIEAGLDMFLMPEKFPLFFSSLCHAIKQEKHRRIQIEQSVDRILNLKKWIHRKNPSPVSHGRIYKITEHPDHVGVSQKLAEKAVTCIHRSADFPLNLPAIKNCLHLIHTDFPITSPPLRTFRQLLSHHFDEITTLINPAKKKLTGEEITGYDLSLISLYSRTFGGHCSRFRWKEINEYFRVLIEKGKPPVILMFGSPFHISRLAGSDRARAVFLLYSYVDSSQVAAFKALTSFAPVQGHLPVRLRTPEGMNSEDSKPIRISGVDYQLHEPDHPIPDMKKIDKLINRSIENKTFPGGVLVVARKSKLLCQKGYGKFSYIPGADTQGENRAGGKGLASLNRHQPAEWFNDVRPDTIYDLASLTKVLATTPAILKLRDERAIRLEDRLSDFYPRISDARLGRATIADLLAHQSGLPAWKPFYHACRSREEVIREILTTPLEYSVGKKSIYSDPGFILLGNIIERVNGLPLDTYCRDHLFRPLGVNSLHFIPVLKNNHSKHKKLVKGFTPPTGFDPFRGRIVAHEVNDTSCYVMGGVAGHAGLFGNARDVAAIGQLFLNKGIYNSHQFLKHRTALCAVQPYRPDISERALGWDTSGETSNAGTYFSPNSFGHLAFTGPSIWVDPEKQLIVVFLCNRTHPDPDVNKMKQFRPALHDAVVEALHGWPDNG